MNWLTALKVGDPVKRMLGGARLRLELDGFLFGAETVLV